MSNHPTQKLENPTATNRQQACKKQTQTSSEKSQTESRLEYMLDNHTTNNMYITHSYSARNINTFHKHVHLHTRMNYSMLIN